MERGLGGGDNFTMGELDNPCPSQVLKTTPRAINPVESIDPCYEVMIMAMGLWSLPPQILKPQPIHEINIRQMPMKNIPPNT